MTTTLSIVSSSNELLADHAALISRVRCSQQHHRRQLHSLQTPPHELLRLPLISSPSPSPPPEESPPSSPTLKKQQIRSDLPLAKKARTARYHNYVPEEETIRNDYSQRYVDGGEWPQNWVLGAEPEHRFEEYPKQQRLLNLKKASVNNHSLPPTYLLHSQLNTLQSSKFDVILLDPPFSSSFTWDHLQELPIPTLAADPSFVFLWVGSGAGEGLERGREVLAKWGYRRCEDVVWVKTNKTANQGPGTDPPTTSLLTRTKQHCLIGIRGTVRRSTDSWFVHCNVDTDVIIWEGDSSDPTRKPPEMYTLIENFCLGIRRLEIFGRPSSLRRGWVTVLGPRQEEHLQARDDGTVHVEGELGGRGSIWNQESWEEGIKELSNGGKAVVPMTPDIDALRPKSPFRPGQTSNQGNTVPVPAGGGGVPMNNRFGQGNRGGFANPAPGPTGQMKAQNQNQMGVQPMMGMGVQQMMGNVVGVDEMMGGWNTMMNGMGGMNNGMSGMNNGMGGMNNGMGGMGHMNHGMGGMSGTMGPGIGVGGMPMNMIGQMNMNNGFGQGMPMFNPTAMNGWVGDQGQYGMDTGWDGDGIAGMNVPGMVNGMNMVGMNMNGMGMGPWGGGNHNGNF